MRFGMTNKVKRTVSEDGQNITFEGNCIAGGRAFSITTKLSDANRWINGECIQNCFPELTTEEREILLSGMDNAYWNELFPSCEHEDETLH